MQQPLWSDPDDDGAVRMPDGRIRRDNITNWALRQYQGRYGPDVTKWSIFCYTYAVLHHPVYRDRYAENLKRDLPRIPFVDDTGVFWRWVAIAKRLMHLHTEYEGVDEYPLLWVKTGKPVHTRVTKMRLTPDKAAIVVNETLTLVGIPPEAFEYRLGTRSALEWVIDQHEYIHDDTTGLTKDPNNPDDPDHIVRLVGQVVAVSVETVALVNMLQADGLPINGEIYR